MSEIRVLLVDDQRMFADVLTTRLNVYDDLRVVGRTKADARACLNAIPASRPDIVLFDFLQLGESAASLMATLRSTFPKIRLVVLTGDEPPAAVLNAVKAGAAAWLSKAAPCGQLVEVIRWVMTGEIWLSPASLSHVIAGLLEDTSQRQCARTRLEDLSIREREVLQCLVDGMNREVAARHLYVTGNTVRTHTRRVFAKLEVHSSLEAVAVAMRAGLRPRVAPQSSTATDRSTDEQLTQMA